MNMNRKKVILYTAAIIAVMTVSLLFNLAVDGIFGKMTYNPGQEESSPGQPVSEGESVSDGRNKGGERRMDDLTDDVENAASGNGNESTVSDIRISGDSIAEFYKERNRGADLDDRYDSLAQEAQFGADCGELEKDRIALVRQLRGCLENTVKDGKDLRSVSVYRMGKEYFVTVDVAGQQKDLHIIRYENGYDFENVFIPSDE